ncbi:aquaporin [Dermatobacter hominis]|uniref:aquaporin n=1 Tax=Dermatobacter hominis TaxID=2884263 RepID=UPI001D100077|nr:MIP/aquaporin family protein [Dermatobacter hominis]UDY37561.1 aquaporin family protein [Dermatobacter hominis]
MADAALGTELELGVPDTSLGRRLVAEFTGTALLVAIVVGSGIAAERASADAGLQLLENAAATGAGLIALILAFGHVSGARFNPLVSATAVLDGDLRPGHGGLEAAVQVAGAITGAVVANLMFELPAVGWSTHERASSGLYLAEVVATFGLITVILGVVRSPRAQTVAFAVGAYIAAAYWFTSSTSFANPAVTIARTATDTFSGIAPGSAPAFIAAQVLGAGLAIALDRYLRPRTTR